MITFQEMTILGKIKKAQVYEDGYVSVYLTKGLIKSGTWNDKNIEKPIEIIAPKKGPQLKRVLSALAEEKWITHENTLNGEETYSAKHKSWHIMQIILLEGLRSILIPIIVSVLTAIVMAL